MYRAGYGDLTPADDELIDKVIAASAMLVGLLLYGYCVALLAATLANVDLPRVQYQEHLFTVKKYMENQNMDKRRRAAVRMFLCRLQMLSLVHTKTNCR